MQEKTLPLYYFIQIYQTMFIDVFVCPVVEGSILVFSIYRTIWLPLIQSKSIDLCIFDHKLASSKFDKFDKIEIIRALQLRNIFERDLKIRLRNRENLG